MRRPWAKDCVSPSTTHTHTPLPPHQYGYDLTQRVEKKKNCRFAQPCTMLRSVADAKSTDYCHYTWQGCAYYLTVVL